MAEILNIRKPEHLENDPFLYVVREGICSAYDNLLIRNNNGTGLKNSQNKKLIELLFANKYGLSAKYSPLRVINSLDEYEYGLFDSIRSLFCITKEECYFSALEIISIVLQKEPSAQAYLAYADKDLAFFKDHYLAIFDYDNNYYVCSSANYFNPDLSIPMYEGSFFDRLTSVVKHEYIEDVFECLDLIEGRNIQKPNWQIRPIGPDEVRDRLTAYENNEEYHCPAEEDLRYGF